MTVCKFRRSAALSTAWYSPDFSRKSRPARTDGKPALRKADPAQKKPNHRLRPNGSYGKSALIPVGGADRGQHLRLKNRFFEKAGWTPGSIHQAQTLP